MSKSVGCSALPLGQVADLGQERPVLPRRPAEDGGRAAGRAGEAGQHPQQRGLAGSVRADQGADPAGRHRDRAVAERGHPAEPLGQPARLDRGPLAVAGIGVGGRREAAF